jgi:23S rRNA (cytosine1962-C5)-methyltransferase
MTQETPTARITLQRNKDQPTVPGHLWLYAGAVGDVNGVAEAGDLVDVYTHSGRFYGRGLFNPHSKIRVRLLTFEEEPIDEVFWAKRLRRADELRRRVVSGTDAYRVIHGEGDLLPGLIVDRYAHLLVMQTLSFGMDRRKELLADLLNQQIKPEAIYLRNEAKSRTLEGLPMAQGFLRGQSSTRLEIMEGPARFEVDAERGQKTGWFCDQRENRLAVASVAKGADILEVFCHTGAFGIQAALQGATSVLGVDVSTEALTMARRHAEMNQVSVLCEYRQADAFEELRALDRAGHRYDLVILDPPAFARSKHAVPHAVAGYKDINLQALRLIRPEGFLATCSCSYHVSEQSLWHTILDAARDAKRQLKLIESRSQSRDHPMLAAMPETRYLKCFIFQVF